jgi:hypothetical protein
MKKALIVLLLFVFVLTFAGTVFAKSFCNKMPCIVEVFPDGSRYICCKFRPAGDHCVVVEKACYWEYY